MDIKPAQLDWTRETQLEAMMPAQAPEAPKPTLPVGADQFAAIVNVAVSSIVAGDNDRLTFEPVALRELADSIEADGLAQPITVRPIAPGRFEIVAGERRFRATQLLGWATVPAIIRDLSDEQAAAIMLLENVHRADLNPLDEALAYRKRMTQFGYTPAEVACKAKVTAQRVRSRLTLLDLIDDVQTLVRAGQLTLGYAEAMTDLDPNRQIIAMRYFSEARRPALAEFKSLCGQLLAEQAQDCLFDMDGFMQDCNAEAEEDNQPRTGRFPTLANLPSFTGAVSVGVALERYISRLLESEHIEAAAVVGTVYDGLIKANLAKPPKNSPLVSLA